MMRDRKGRGFFLRIWYNQKRGYVNFNLALIFKTATRTPEMPATLPPYRSCNDPKQN
jgi:hypothetical protein